MIVTNKHFDEIEKNTLDQHCGDWSIWHCVGITQFNVIWIIYRKVGLKCFFHLFCCCCYWCNEPSKALTIWGRGGTDTAHRRNSTRSSHLKVSSGFHLSLMKLTSISSNGGVTVTHRRLSLPTADRLTGVVGCYCRRTVVVVEHWRLTCTAELLSKTAPVLRVQVVGLWRWGDRLSLAYNWPCASTLTGCSCPGETSWRYQTVCFRFTEAALLFTPREASWCLYVTSTSRTVSASAQPWAIANLNVCYCR